LGWALCTTPSPVSASEQARQPLTTCRALRSIGSLTSRNRRRKEPAVHVRGRYDHAARDILSRRQQVAGGYYGAVNQTSIPGQRN
jgi:hypothetical protein